MNTFWKGCLPLDSENDYPVESYLHSSHSIVFYWGENADHSAWEEYEEIDFLCGPMSKEGGLSDTITINDALEKEMKELFSDSPMLVVNIGEAENYHTITWDHTKGGKPMFDSIKDRIEEWCKKKQIKIKSDTGNNLEEWIGKKVFKTSGKPFKSQFKVNTVKGVTTNPHTNFPAFTFEEDDSVVDAWKCELK